MNITIKTLFVAGLVNIGLLAASSCANGQQSQMFTRVAAGTVPDFTAAAESTINGVVSIKSYATQRSYNYGSNRGGGFDPFSDPFFDFFFGTPSERQQPRQRRQPNQSDRNEKSQNERPLGLGSGVILSDDGYIVTNNHVIDGADRIEVTLNDNQKFNATVVGTDPSTDLALIKIDAKDLPVIPVGDSDDLKIGEWVLAVGNPFGLTSTVTAGIVSAKARSISAAAHQRSMGIESYIQTDAAVNPGNSGGALVNLKGELVGINTAIYSQTGNYAGYSFAIPTSIMKKIMADIKQYGTVQRAVLGVSYTELTPELIKEKDVKGVKQGLYVMEVVDQSAAMEAGLKEGDVITAINGQPTHNSSQLVEQMSQRSPGDRITLTYFRDGKSKNVDITLYNSQGSTKLTHAKNIADLGCAFKKPSEETMSQLRITSGVQVSGLKDGRFKDAGIKNGFIITEINNARVSSTEDVDRIYDAILKSNDSDQVMFITGFYPTGKKMYYAVDLAD